MSATRMAASRRSIGFLLAVKGSGAASLGKIHPRLAVRAALACRPVNGESRSMQVKRIVANLATEDIVAARSFYQGILGLDLLMDHGWLVTYGSSQKMSVQVSIASEGGSGTPVPDLSIEVDDLDTALQRMKEAKVAIEYGPADEPWGVRRFYVRDPLGRLINILMHS
jgi:catechol 2,3-dioxygenase-like lactoylglutathione lyase family enzyme